MKETDFIKQNSQTWRSLEENLSRKGRMSSHRDMGEDFVRLSEDLSYAQTYYPRRTVRLYLNGLAQKMYKRVFNARQQDRQGFKRFWTHELPTALWEARLELTVALLAFLLAVFIGVVSSRYDDGFASQILGKNYINMTEENIAKGDPMGVYKHMGAVEMFFMIMYNNLRVSVITFVLGILFGLGTLGILFRNGVMLGVFQYFFVQRELGFESFLTIWQHGTIEIASIVVAGAAGLVLGRSIIFPGTLPRSVSLKFGFLKGLKILLGVAPLVVLAAFIESFYTRFDDLPVAFRLLTIFASLVFILGYYVWLPIRRGRSQSLLRDIEEDYSHSHTNYEINMSSIKSNGEILGDSLLIIQQNLPKFMRSALLPTIVLTLLVVWPMRDTFRGYFYFTPLSGEIFKQLAMTVADVIKRFSIWHTLMDFSSYLYVWPVFALVMAWVVMQIAQLFGQLLPGSYKRQPRKIKSFLALTFVQLIVLSPMLISPWLLWFHLFLGFPTCAVAWYVYQQREVSLGRAHVIALNTLLSWLVKHLGMFIITMFFSALVSVLVQSPVLYVAFELANEFVGFSENKSIYLVEATIIFATLLTYICGMAFLGLTSIMNFRSMFEMSYAEELMDKIKMIKPIANSYGR